MTDDVTIYVGDSSDTFAATVTRNDVKVTGNDLEDYTGTLAVKKKLTDDPLLTFVMVRDATTDTLQTKIRPEDSITLDPGVYHVIIEIENTDVDYRKENHSKLIVKAQGFEA